MIYRIQSALAVCALFGAVITGCSKDGSMPAGPETPSSQTKSFSADVLPLIQKHGCLNCHGDPAGYYVGSVAGLLKGGPHGPVVIPYNADSSNIIRKLGPNPPFGARMPRNGTPLPDGEIQVIKDWIDQGAKDN